MPKLKKVMLHVGKYTTDGETVNVTPKRLRHWAKMHSDLRKNEQVVPVDWDHVDDATQAVPLSIPEFKKRRSAKNTIGHLRDFKVSKDGKSAEIVLDIRNKEAFDAAEQNLIAVSPVIFKSWKDGGDNSYVDVITHMDFVNHPVDHSQGPFEKMSLIRMGLDQGKPLMYKLAMDDEEEEDDEEDDDDDILEFDDDDFSTDDTSDDTNMDVAAMVEKVAEDLTAINIAPPENVDIEKDPAGYLAQISTAAKQKKMDEDGSDLNDDLEDDDDDLFDLEGDDEVTVTSPEFAAMGRKLEQADKRAKAAEKMHVKMSRQDIGRQLDELFKSGRLSGDEHKKSKERLTTVKMSLNDDGDLVDTDVHQLIRYRKTLPEGAVWDPEQRLAKEMSIVEPPISVKGNSVSKEDAKKIVDDQVSRNPGMFKK